MHTSTPYYQPKAEDLVTPAKRQPVLRLNTTSEERKNGRIAKHQTAPILKLNVYNAHRVDDIAQNQAIVISDLSVAAEVAFQDRKSSSSHKQPPNV